MPLVTLDQVRAALNLGDDVSKDDELDEFIAEITEYVESQVGTLPSAQYTETAMFYDGKILTRRWPILTVVSLANTAGTSYLTGSTIGTGAYSLTHNVVTSGEWTVTYTAGYAVIPASLRRAALEDIRGLYQPGQIGPAAAFGAFGVENTDTGPTYRPVRMWPRVDAWIASRYGPAIA